MKLNILRQLHFFLLTPAADRWSPVGYEPAADRPATTDDAGHWPDNSQMLRRQLTAGPEISRHLLAIEAR